MTTQRKPALRKPMPLCVCGHPHEGHYFGDRTMGTPCLAGDDFYHGCPCKQYEEGGIPDYNGSEEGVARL